MLLKQNVKKRDVVETYKDKEWLIFKKQLNITTLLTQTLLIQAPFPFPDGYYVYIETSGNRRNGDKARLVSPNVNGGQYCLTFWYFMYGQNVDHFNVYVMAGNTLPSAPLWTRQRSQGNQWRKAMVDIPTVASTFNVSFQP